MAQRFDLHTFPSIFRLPIHSVVNFRTENRQYCILHFRTLNFRTIGGRGTGYANFRISVALSLLVCHGAQPAGMLSSLIIIATRTVEARQGFAGNGSRQKNRSEDCAVCERCLRRLIEGKLFEQEQGNLRRQRSRNRRRTLYASINSSQTPTVTVATWTLESHRSISFIDSSQ